MKKGTTVDTHEPKKIKAVYTNARSVVMKMNELKVVAAEMQPDIIIITETWTHPDITNDYLILDGYETTARSDRSDTTAGRGGGILDYTRLYEKGDVRVGGKNRNNFQPECDDQDPNDQ